METCAQTYTQNLTMQDSPQTKECLTFLGKQEFHVLSLILFFFLIDTRKRMSFQSQTKHSEDMYSASTLWSICPQGVKCHVYAHAYVYVPCLPNLPDGFVLHRGHLTRSPQNSTSSESVTDWPVISYL